MKRIWIVAVAALLSAGRSKAGDVTETNAMPADIRNLMETEGYAMKPSDFSHPMHNTNSLRCLPLVERTRFTPFKMPKPKEHWNLWNNSSIRHVGRTDAQMNLFSLPLAQYEYDITYSFEF